jgi:type VI secretion system secreted protein Hcp
MSVDIFLKLGDKIKGESIDEKHKDEIQIDSISFGANQQSNAAYGQGLGAGKVAFSEMHLTKQLDKSTPEIFLSLSKGDHIGTAIVTLRKAGGGQEDYCVFTFTDLLVTSQQISGSQGAIFMESLSLSFTEFKVKYGVQDAKGKITMGNEYGFNVKTNKPVGG